MSLPREHKKAQPPWLDLAVFAGVLAFLAYSIQSFLGARAPSAAPTPPPTPLASGDALAPVPERAPASASAPGVGSTEILRVNCLHAASHGFSSTARLMQIHSPFCDGEEKSAAWHAVNRTSGEEILVFVNAREKSLSTSYFNLREGTNELEFTEELGAGKTRRNKLLVTRKAD
jgi:hypothetical protein